MPKRYVIARATVIHPSQWAEYAAKAGEACKKYGGRFVPTCSRRSTAPPANGARPPAS